MTAVTPGTSALEIAIPPSTDSLPQDKEWCVVQWNGTWQRVHIHDYEKIYSIPGLYERLIYDILDCRSPGTIRDLLQRETRQEGVDGSDLRVLDLGAGNGIVAERLSEMGVDTVVGVDIIPEAQNAAERDRPGIYRDYHVVDMTSLEEQERRDLEKHRFNCMVCVAALGFGDIPTDAFLNAFAMVETSGWIAFNIKHSFLEKTDQTGFSRLIRSMTARGALEVQSQHRYQHRLGTDGEPIHYVAIVGRKLMDFHPQPELNGAG